MPVVSGPIALGKIACKTVCHFVAPSAIDASVYVGGTPASDCCVTRMSAGRLSSVSVSAPPRAVKCQWNVCTKISKPKRPMTIDGTVASDSALNCTMSRNRPGRAYSCRYTPAATAIGTVKSSVRKRM